MDDITVEQLHCSSAFTFQITMDDQWVTLSASYPDGRCNEITLTKEDGIRLANKLKEVIKDD